MNLLSTFIYEDPSNLKRKREDILEVEIDNSVKVRRSKRRNLKTETKETVEIKEEITQKDSKIDKEIDQSENIHSALDLHLATREKCNICLSNYVNGDEIKSMKCRHGFHKECLDKWLVEYVNSCPICRTKIPVTNNIQDETTEDGPDRDHEFRPIINISIPLNRESTSEHTRTAALEFTIIYRPL